MLQKTYITLLFLLVASSAFAQKTERDYLRSGNKLYNDSLFINPDAQVLFEEGSQLVYQSGGRLS